MRNQNKNLKKEINSFSVKVIGFLFSSVKDKKYLERCEGKLKEIEQYPEHEKESAYSLIYLDVFNYLTEIEKKYVPQNLKNLLLAEFKDTKPRGVLLLAFDEKKQTFILVSQFIDALYQTSRPLIGEGGFKKIIFPIVKGESFEKIKINEKIDWGDVKITSSPHTLLIADKILIEFYGRLKNLFGEDLTREIMEGYFRLQFNAYKYLPVIYDILGIMPGEILQKERRGRLVYLENLVDKKAKNIALVNERLVGQTKELIKTVDEAREANKRLKIVDRARSEFVKVVSHQFRTPLSVIRWNADSLRESLESYAKKEEKDLDLLITINVKAKFLVDALNKIFHVLAIETASITLDKRPEFLWEIIQDISEEAREVIKRKKINFKFDKSQDPLKELFLDKEKIKETIKIFLTNALNYNKEGGNVKIKINPTQKDEKSYLLTSINDDGIGIAKEDLDKVFEKFFRGENAVRTVPDGTGLGMYIAKQFIEMHGGEITVKSEKNKGCEVVFTLPIESKN